jgi:glycosyltransferase involved in cell wall biosynthesis
MTDWRELLLGTAPGRFAVRLRRRAKERAALAGSPLFDAEWYLRRNPEAAPDPIAHYLDVGAARGLRPSPWFDTAWYLERNPDLAAGGENPLAHYIRFGAAEGRNPNPFFFSRWYLANNPGAAGFSTPLDHYVRDGARALRDPSPLLDARWYAECWPEAAADPLAHFLLEGRAAGRAPAPQRRAPAGQPVEAARLEAFKALEEVTGETVALFAAHAPGGRLKPNVGPYVAALAEAGVRVVLVAATDAPFVPDPEVTAHLAGGFVRDNLGYDFASWAHVMRCEPGLFAAGTVLLLNDSLIGPGDPAALKALLARVAASGADVVGATESQEQAWHLQSFFLAFKGKALSSPALHGLFGEVRALADKDEVIRLYEVPLASQLAEAGLPCEALFPNPDGLNQTVFHWRALVAAGFPFVKTLTLRGAYEGVDVSDWREALAPHGFDPAVIEATLEASSAPTKPARGKWPLLKAPTRPATPAPPWKVAFVGPWNYATGLGEAGRGYISALWRTGARLNLHPVEKPFGDHPRVAPSLPAHDFDGPADVAIVHLTPDAWTLMTEAQAQMVARARTRVGLWVWEMGHVPANWRPNFDAVDAIWAPSRYCAEVFAREAKVRVDVVPHVVPLGPVPLPRAGAERTVLYAFDGASYIERKNPQALVRAFAAAGLAARGWRLVLKTKSLMAHPEAGAPLAALAAATPGVELIDRPMSRGEVADLFAGADLYASPHRSEGFGLTIAEAMAAGKPVVATDYGGSRDLLDAACGWPVPAREVSPKADLGHYTRAGVWGEVDEAALAAALDEAAAAVEAGDATRGQAARARVAERLSPEAVGAAMLAAIDALMAERAR